MNAFLTLRAPSTVLPTGKGLQAFSEYKAREQLSRNSTPSEGVPEYETLALRIEPTNVEIDNATYEDKTVIVVDSANRPGTLVEVAQCLTELGLNVVRARISSDGGWFVDDFHVTENDGSKVTNQKKLDAIKRVLSVDENERTPIDQLDEHKQHSTVFEIAGQDKPGLLADILQLLITNGCDVRSAAVWTSRKGRVACVVSVLEPTAQERNVLERANTPGSSLLGRPVTDPVKQATLKQLLLQKVSGEEGGEGAQGIVNAQHVKGLIHYERRLHQLMLQDDEARWERLKVGIMGDDPEDGFDEAAYNEFDGPLDGGNANEPQPDIPQELIEDADEAQSDPPVLVSKKFGKPEISITPCKHLNYWVVSIKCKERNKLFFDTVCTLADLHYDVYHASVDTENEASTQWYYIRPRKMAGMQEIPWDALAVAKLQYLLQSSILRRFPPGLKLHIHNSSRDCLATLTKALKDAGFTVTRAKVRAYSESEGHTISVMRADGCAPEVNMVKAVCQNIGGTVYRKGKYGEMTLAKEAADVGHKFAFCFENFNSPNGRGGVSRSS